LSFVPLGLQQVGNLLWTVLLDQFNPLRARFRAKVLSGAVFHPTLNVLQSDLDDFGIFPNPLSRQLGQLEANPILALMWAGKFHDDLARLEGLKSTPSRAGRKVQRGRPIRIFEKSGNLSDNE